MHKRSRFGPGNDDMVFASILIYITHHSWNMGGWVFDIWVKIFSIKREGLFLKKGYLIFSYYLILPNVFCLCVWDVLVCVSLIYTIFISVFCVSWKDLNLTESNQQACDFYKWAVFLNQGHCGTLQRKFLISANYSFSVIQTAAVSTLQVVLIYVYMSESGYWVLLVPCGFVCVSYIK